MQSFMLPSHVASKIWCLGRYLPLLCGDLIQDTDDYGEHYLLLLAIMDHIFTPVTSADSCVYLQFMIEEYLETWTKLNQDRTLTPKMHYMVHLPTLMAK